MFYLITKGIEVLPKTDPRETSAGQALLGLQIGKLVQTFDLSYIILFGKTCHLQPPLQLLTPVKFTSESCSDAFLAPSTS